MIKRYLISLFGGLFSSTLFAFPCFFTLVKDKCWHDYSVTVNVSKLENLKPTLLFTIVVPKEKNWERQAFVCEPGQKLSYTATFEPTIWQNDAGRIYNAQRFWALPDNPPADDQKAWEVSVCFPEAFAEVPFPPHAVGNCRCDFSQVPPIVL